MQESSSLIRLFEPYANIDKFEGVVPTAKGLVAVSCATLDGVKHYTLALPKGAKIESKLPENAGLEIKEY